MSETMAPAAEWHPGDALNRRVSSNTIYNWRDESAGPVCNCHDAARWPIPATAFWDLGPGDELGRFIAEFRACAGGQS